MRSRLVRQMGVVVTALVLAIAGTIGTLAVTHPAPAKAAYSWVGPKSQYLALGDSLGFGYQPDFNWDDGYAQDFYYGNLQSHGVSSLTNYACNGETSVTMINGDCPYGYVLHDYYFGSQLDAAVNYLNANQGLVSPVTLDMGANDLLPDINKSTCAISSTWTNDYSTLDVNLRTIILPRLVAALTDSSGHRTGDLVMMNYYDPLINVCPNSLPYVQQVNTLIAHDASLFNVPVVNVYGAFGGNNMGATICTNTWICNYLFHDIHPKNAGYQIIANAFASTTGY